jgi:transaldolase
MDCKSTHIFADTAAVNDIKMLMSEKYVSGFTTNPSLIKKTGALDYAKHCKEILSIIGELPVSFEVFADDLDAMKKQALQIASWGKNIFVKIPIMNTKKELTISLISELTTMGIKINITALFLLDHIKMLMASLHQEAHVLVSVFAGRIADTGRDPLFLMKEALSLTKNHPNAKLLWASTREVFNIVQAVDMNCPVITVPTNLLVKLKEVGKNLEDCCLDTVKNFYHDATSCGYKL